mmetsp:Transcript_79062/g.212178  ORF Transcript_79062/g.212178 Transcript_79062/m.212178 type:complete len:123 (+) Transcript_79062:696-1064(+)
MPSEPWAGDELRLFDCSARKDNSAHLGRRWPPPAPGEDARGRALAGMLISTLEEQVTALACGRLHTACSIGLSHLCPRPTTTTLSSSESRDSQMCKNLFRDSRIIVLVLEHGSPIWKILSSS